MKNIKKLLGIILIISMIMPMILPLRSNAEEIVVSMESTDTQIKAGDTINIKIYVTGGKINYFSGYLDYDKNIFQTIVKSNIVINPQLVADEDYGMWGKTLSATGDKISVSENDGNSYTIPDNGLLATIKLTALVDANTSRITLNNVALVNELNKDLDIGTVFVDVPATAGENYTISYQSNTSDTVTNMPANSQKEEGTNYTIASNIPERTGYTFSGWNTVGNGSGTSYAAGATYSTDANLDLYAQWTRISKTLTVNPNGGTWGGSSTQQTFTQEYGTTKTINNPSSAPNGNLVKFNANGGTTPTLQTTQTKSFNKWTLTGAGSFTGTTYTYGTDNGTLTASYTGNSITLPTPTKTGATFLGWYTAAVDGERVGGAGDAYTPTNPITLSAMWNDIDYTLTVNPNGGKWNDKTETSNLIGKYNSTKEIADPTVPNGYTVTLNENYGTNNETEIVQTTTFDKWTLTGAGSISGTTYTYGTNNGTLTASYIGNNVTLADPSERTGYTFDGWYTDAENGTKVDATYMPAGDITLYAHWTANKYTVTFNPNYGTVNPATKEVTYDKTYGELPVAIRSGYDFRGWNNESNEKIISTDIVKITTDIELIAEWTGSIYKVTFDNRDGTESEKDVQNEKQYGELPEAPEKEGYTFKGWYTQTTGGSQILSSTIVNLTSDITLYAQYQIKQATLTVNPNGGKWNGSTESQDFEQNYATTKEIANPTETPNGYTITLNENYGENNETDVVQTKSFDEWTLTGAGTFVGTTYTYGVNNGTLTASYIGNNVTLADPSERTGYTFDGWYTDAENGEKVDATYMPTGDITLYAHWKEKEYTVTFNAGENAIVHPSTKQVTYDKEYGELPEATKEGYRFLGWYTEETEGTKVESSTIVKITDTITLYAQYQIKQLTLTVNPNGGTWNESTESQDFEQNYATTKEITNPVAPENGYTVTLNQNCEMRPDIKVTQTNSFDKWILTGAGSISETTYTYGGDNATLTASYIGNSVILPDPPERIGYRFVGWYTLSIGGEKIESPYTPTENITLAAQWEKNKYTITFDAGENGSVEIESKEYEYYDLLGELPEATKYGHTFLGWATEDGTMTNHLSRCEKSEVLYAQYEIIKSTLTVNPNGGKWNESTESQNLKQDYTSTKEITNPTETPNGYTVTLNNNDGVSEDKEIIQTTTFDKWTLTGAGTLEGKIYTYGLKDGTIEASYIANNVTLPEATRKGHTFEGWYTQAEGGKKITSTSYKPTENVTLYAHWTVNKYIINFIVEENVLIDTLAKQVTYGEAYGELPTPEFTGYDFEGWYDENNNLIKADTIVDIEEDQDLYAGFEGMTYKVTFDYNGGEGTVIEKDVKNNEAYNELPEATKEKYTFVGWYNEKDEKVTEETIVKTTKDIVLQARYEKNKYTVTFYNNDGTTELETMEVEEGNQAIFTKKNPEKVDTTSGYTAQFIGWDKSTENIIESTDFIAQYTETPIEYTITYNDIRESDNSENPEKYTIEDEDIELKDLEKQNGEIFTGWYLINEEEETEEKVTSIDTSKLENIILYAKWEKEKLYLKSEKYKIGENDIDKYEEDDIYFDKIEPNTKVSDLINNCDTNGTITIINKDGEELDTEAIVGTNMTIKVTKDDEEITLTTVVMGDLDGNGIVTATDLSTINQCILKLLDLKDAEFKAGDLDDNNKISATDLSTINSVILKVLTLKYDKQ